MHQIVNNMQELSTENAVAYLHATGRLPPDLAATAEPLSGGVSNLVLRIRPQRGPEFVVKQSRAQLRTDAAWFSDLERIRRECSVLRRLGEILPAGTVPRVLFEDRENYLVGMEAVEPGHRVWKADLLAGRIEDRYAVEAGRLLGLIHRESFALPQWAAEFGDRRAFEQLRVDPYYRRVAEVHSSIASQIDALIEQMATHACCLTHADFSPKNLLITSRSLALVDHETGHWGDPAFDVGFFLTHLALKRIVHAKRGEEFARLVASFDTSYKETVGELQPGPLAPAAWEPRAVLHLAACLLARIDGKSRIEYLDGQQRQFTRRFALEMFHDPPPRLQEVFERLGERRASAR
ncbi:MAG: phosphotransferase family protein [Planctomycetaceae bacterium]